MRLLTSLNGIHIHIHPLLPHSIVCAMSFVNVSVEEVHLKQHYCSYHLLDIDPGRLWSADRKPSYPEIGNDWVNTTIHFDLHTEGFQSHLSSNYQDATWNTRYTISLCYLCYMYSAV